MVDIFDSNSGSKNFFDIRNRNTITILAFVVLVIGMIATYVYFGFQKESYHVDEIYTFGLSNSYYEPFLTEENAAYQWNSPNFYLDYLTVSQGEEFTFDSVYYNQAHDVHPPLYYYLFHSVCSIFTSSYSIWLGVIINILLALCTVITIYHIGLLIFKDKVIAAICSVAYGFSAAVISNVVFIRMYMLLTLITVLATLVYGLIAVREEKWRYFALGVLLNTLGLLTHHLYIIFIFLMAYVSLMKWIVKKDGKMVLLHTALLLTSVAISIVAFPESINMIFHGGRGIINLMNIFNVNKIMVNFYTLGKYLVNSIYGGIITTAIIIIVLLIFALVRKSNPFLMLSHFVEHDLGTEERSFLEQIFFVMILIFLFNILTSPYASAHRYFAYMYPFIYMFSVLFGYVAIKNVVSGRNKTIVMLIVVIVGCTGASYMNNSVDYLYREKDDNLDAILSEYQNYDAYCITTRQNNMSIAIPLLLKHPKSCYISSDISFKGFQMMHNQSDNMEEPVVVYFPRWNLEGDTNEEFIEDILSVGPHTTYSQIMSAEESGLATDMYFLE